MTTETDDLSYYEHDLPKIIAAVRRGEKWEAAFIERDDYYMPKDQSLNGMTKYISQNRRVRLAPVPVVKWWDCGSDVPGPICWIQWADGSMDLVTSIREDGICANSNYWHWSNLKGAKHSTDLRNWSDCVKPEGGK